jgi:hypothetical protein
MFIFLAPRVSVLEYFITKSGKKQVAFGKPRGIFSKFHKFSFIGNNFLSVIHSLFKII